MAETSTEHSRGPSEAIGDGAPPAVVPTHWPPHPSRNQSLFSIAEMEGRGRGLLAEHDIRVGELIEAAPCIYFARTEVEAANSTVLRQYTFIAGEGLLLALGHGSLFNHSRTPNVSYEKDIPARIIRYYAARPIAKGEELTIFYGRNLWFEEEGEPMASQSDEEQESDAFGALFCHARDTDSDNGE
eukprot:TRINITY_DN2282_c0_g1_i2.p1 TRINITY_DN2282_c0_g1~~TRINITY_DN2282_c0_g1_i2.p1  ORF type:complete len:186 (+),score=43.42 TRINITY_DN2282_c0_g1_i2:397-954(+)